MKKLIALALLTVLLALALTACADMLPGKTAATQAPAAEAAATPTVSATVTPADTAGAPAN